MFPLYPHPASAEMFVYERPGSRNRLMNRMDVERLRVEHQRMSYVSSEHELHARYLAERRVHDALEAERRREAQSTVGGTSIVQRLRIKIGTMLIELGEQINPAASAERQNRVIIPRAPRAKHA